MKIEAGLLRPFIDITGIVDGCAQMNLEGRATVPPIDATVSEIPVKLHIRVKSFGITVIKAKIDGTVGGFSAAVNFQKPITFGAEACVKGVARINPKKPITTGCCEEYHEDPCGCHD